MAFSHITTGRGTERLPEHRHKTWRTLITKIVGDLLERGTISKPLDCQNDSELLTSSTEAHAGFSANKAQERSFAQADALGPDLKRAAITGRGHHKIDHLAQAHIGRHRQM